MDLTLLTGAASAIKASLDIAQVGLAARDASQIREALFEVNNKLINLQTTLLDTAIKVGTLASELSVAQEENRKLKATLQQRSSYELFKLAGGQFVMRSKVDQGSGSPVGSEPAHYLCQRCFAEGHTMVLQPEEFSFGKRYRCPLCSFDIPI